MDKIYEQQFRKERKEEEGEEEKKEEEEKDEEKDDEEEERTWRYLARPSRRSRILQKIKEESA